MNILGIETSCDETALAIVQDGRTVLVNLLSSSMKEFSTAGGVIPEVAARKQIEFLPVLLTEILQSQVAIDEIAFTNEPGLQSSLMVGRTAAHTLGELLQVPVRPVNHIFGHMSSIWLETDETIEFPVLTLSVSGGHTELHLRKCHTENILLGSTRDDAIGEAFDKGALLLGLPYPGGPAIHGLAKEGNASYFTFPRPLKHTHDYDFSFSGLKTSLKYLLESLKSNELATHKADIAASYQHGLCLHLLDIVQKATTDHTYCKELHITGGVSANTHLIELARSKFKHVTVRTPSSSKYCTDNAAMIAAAAYFSRT